MNLLYDPVFTVRTSKGEDRYSLPRVYDLLRRDEVEAFSKLQAHQKQAWHCFLAQLGAIATEGRDLPASEDGWREALADLAEPEAWNLYTEDLSKPAFMQPPVPEGMLEDFSEIHPTEYDVPVLSKSHALKIRRMHDPESGHWVYLLVNVQTTGFYSPGGRRTSRMNGSYASRSFFGLTPSLRLGLWIMHDIRVLREHASEIEDRYEYKRNVTPLLWTVTWDGEESIELKELHPLYIDCARRIRKGRDTWMKNTTSAERITGETSGQTGDPWAPVNTAEDKVLNPGRAAFQYRQLSQILFSGRYRRPISFKETTEGYVVCRAVTGEQGGRVHNLERVIPFSNTESADPFEEPGESAVAEEAEWRVEKAGEAESILTHVLLWLLKDFDAYGKNAEKERKRVRDLPEYKRAANALHAAIDARFFDRLFDAPQMTDEERSAFWETILVTILREQVREAFAFAKRAHYWERLGNAQSILDRRIRSTFTYADQITNAERDEHGERTVGEDGERVEESDARAVADL